MNNVTYLLDNSPISQWQTATWENYLAACEDPNWESAKIFFYDGYLLIEMGNEGINHARFNSLLTMIFVLWFSSKGGAFDDLGGCVIEKPNVGGGAPDRVLYVGKDFPQWQTGEPRKINLDKWRVPDLVCE
ncbi:Uma2 family endonuclease, partial [Aerosakkonemataceae cyanobacterium BLCC-F167]